MGFNLRGYLGAAVERLCPLEGRPFGTEVVVYYPFDR